MRLSNPDIKCVAVVSIWKIKPAIADSELWLKCSFISCVRVFVYCIQSFIFRFALCKLMYSVFSFILLSANKRSFVISNISVVSHTLKLQTETIRICSSMLPSEHFPPSHPFFLMLFSFSAISKEFQRFSNMLFWEYGTLYSVFNLYFFFVIYDP